MALEVLHLDGPSLRVHPERLVAALEETGETDALVVMQGSIKSVPLVLAVFEFDFMGGSMGSVVGERFVRGVRVAIEQTVREKLPDGFQRAEFLLEKGAIDMIVDRRQLRDELPRLLALLQRQPLPTS